MSSLNENDFDTTLVCRFYNEPMEFRELSPYLARNGWIVMEREFENDGVAVEYTAKSLDGLEMLFSVRNKKSFPDSKTVENLFKTLLNCFWYVDVYHCFKNINVSTIAEKIGLSLETSKTSRLKLGRIEVSIQGYTSTGKLIISYRVGLREVDDVKKIYSKLLYKILTLKGVKNE